MFSKSIFAFLFLSFLFASAAFAQGGPPVVTDDPGTPGDGHWEINTAGIWLGSADGYQLQLPYVDANYGWGDHIQLKVETGYMTERPPQGLANSGEGAILAGVKWRFIGEETSGFALSTYPQIQSHPFFASSDPNIADSGTEYILPIEFSKSFDKFGLNPEVGYVMSEVPDYPNEYFYGCVVSYEFEKDREVLFEIHGRARENAPGRELLYNIGGRYAFSESVSAIGAVGHTWVTYQEQAPYTLVYLGVQTRL
jgi:hypothetical protein